MLFFSDNLMDKEKHAVMGEGILTSQKQFRRLLQEEKAGLEPKQHMALTRGRQAGARDEVATAGEDGCLKAAGMGEVRGYVTRG